MCKIYIFRFPHVRPFFNTFSKSILVISCIGCLLQAVAAEAPAAVMVGALCCPCKFTAVIIMIAMAESEEGTWFQLKFQGLLKARLDCDFALKINIKAMEVAANFCNAQCSNDPQISGETADLPEETPFLCVCPFQSSELGRMSMVVSCCFILSRRCAGSREGLDPGSRTVHDLITLHQSQTLEAAEKEWRQRWAAGPVASVELRSFELVMIVMSL